MLAGRLRVIVERPGKQIQTDDTTGPDDLQLHIAPDWERSIRPRPACIERHKNVVTHFQRKQTNILHGNAMQPSGSMSKYLRELGVKQPAQCVNHVHSMVHDSTAAGQLWIDKPIPWHRSMVRCLDSHDLAKAFCRDQPFCVTQGFAETDWETNSQGHIMSFTNGEHFSRVHGLGRDRLLTQDRNLRSSKIQDHRLVMAVSRTDQDAIYDLW